MPMPDLYFYELNFNCSPNIIFEFFCPEDGIFSEKYFLNLISSQISTLETLYLFCFITVMPEVFFAFLTLKTEELNARILPEVE